MPNGGLVFFFFQAEDGIRDVERSRGLGDVYKRQVHGDEKKIESIYDSIDYDGDGTISLNEIYFCHTQKVLMKDKEQKFSEFTQIKASRKITYDQFANYMEDVNHIIKITS
eukprot:TRINITY_DN9605_c0_g1_i1.p2 TRINITY_DN9605_c0_g1~~TRINITY_DN9605_c0_g1_i1.p2  ORF type:complete len:111 (-),score=37.67 TRINITY_DN9605_c0_g1_i1:88-420(-)